ncbi:substrate-binding domain-containing protein [Actinomadura rayongensis]|uniref:Solute-binding protein n=1 Tax=Actinomadura rayongensis TaxID=1429076 RepID=A0A6I4W045_9ACTN|nr:substrate-binding domain-containing protein [Actinomadura rayongensis]MXQ63617.1 solute-binding protein [Actinomadura rayongensis]
MPDSPLRRRTALVLLLCGLSWAVQGCGSSGPTTLTVFATSSLTEVFGELGARYGQTHPGVRIDARFGASADVAGRVADREPADLLVTGDETALNAAENRLTGRRRIIARTGLTIAVAPGNPRRLQGLADLTRPGLRVVVGAAVTPIGRYSRQVFTRSGLPVRWTAEEVGSRAVLDRVRSGMADAGLVYVTDLRSAGAAADSVPIPAADNVVAAFAASVVKGGHEDRAAAFLTWLTGTDAARLFAEYGFSPPGAVH